MKKFMWVIIIAALYLVFHQLIAYFALSSIGKIRIVAEPNIDTRLAIYYSTGIAGHPFTEKNSVRSQQLKRGIVTGAH